jgi:hypothetical protein
LPALSRIDGFGPGYNLGFDTLSTYGFCKRKRESKQVTYANVARTITTAKPSSTARREASEALITDAHPLIPHAQGTFLSSVWEQRVNPVGKGKPIKNAGRAIRINEVRSFITTCDPVTH